MIEESCGVRPAVYDMRYVKPMDTCILEEAASVGRILTVEEGSLAGGLFGAVTEYMASNGHLAEVRGLGIPDRYIPQDRQDAQRAECGLDARGIMQSAMDLIKIEEKSQKNL